MADKEKEKDDAPEPNSVDLLNRQYAEEGAKAAEKPPEPNSVDEINRAAQGGEPTAAAQTEAQEASLNPEGGVEETDGGK